MINLEEIERNFEQGTLRDSDFRALLDELRSLHQTAGILCEECGHRFIRLPDEPCLNCFVFSDSTLVARFERIR
jgi:hypothetical protein